MSASFGKAANFFASLAGGTEAPDTLISGFRDVQAGGLSVGSKTVGSGSAATTIPPVAGTAAQITTTASGEGAVSGPPVWLWYVLGVLGALALLSTLRRRS